MSENSTKKWRAASLAESRLTTLLLGILVVIAAGFVLHLLQSIFKPLLLAIFLSFLFEPMVQFFMRLKFPKFLAFSISLILVFVVLYLIGLMVFASISAFTEEFPKYEPKFVSLYKSVTTALNIPAEQLQWKDIWNTLSIPSFLSSVAGPFIGFITDLFLILLFTIYIVLGKSDFISKISKAFTKNRAEQINTIYKNINKGMQKYLVTKTLISLLTGAIAFIILSLFRVEFAFIWGLLTFLLNFIPNIGSVIATVPPIFVAFFQFGTIFPTLWIALLLMTTQMSIGNFIEPRIVGKRLHLSPLVVILSLIFWGFIWGPVGMVIAVPISCALQIVCANIENLKPVSVFLGGE
ncbi:AI-2E family transporter [bacterium]